MTQSPPICKSLLSHENDFAEVCLLIKPNFILLWRGRGERKEGKGEINITVNNKHLKKERKTLQQLRTSPYKLYSVPCFSVSSIIFPSIIGSFPSYPLPTPEGAQFPHVLHGNMLVFTLPQDDPG